MNKNKKKYFSIAAGIIVSVFWQQVSFRLLAQATHL